MPRTGASPTMGERPTTGTPASAIASRIPGTARMVPTETTGLDGGNSTTSASAIASSTPGAGLACSAPTSTRVGRQPTPAAAPSTPGSARPCARRRSRRPHGSRPGRRSSGSAVPRLPPVAQRLGHRAQRIPRRRSSACARCGWRSPGRRARTTRVRRRRPRVLEVEGLLGPPQPCSSLMPPPSVYITVSRSGQTFSPKRWMSSPVLPMTVMSASGAACFRPRRKRAPPMPPARTTIRMEASLAGGYDIASRGHDVHLVVGLVGGAGRVHRHLGQAGVVRAGSPPAPARR
ncbi:hypothetical protein SALBM311S_01588 [Streptomyces alboniger]